MTDKEKFKYYLSIKGTSIEKFAKDHKLSESSLKNYIYKPKNNTGYKFILELAKAAADLNKMWWLFDEGREEDMFIVSEENEVKDPRVIYFQDKSKKNNLLMKEIIEEIKNIKKEMTEFKVELNKLQSNTT